MKFVVDREPLIDAVNWVARSLSSRPIQTALLGIKLEVSEKITLTGSDLETSTKAVISADISEKGTVLVPGRLLAEIARSLPAKPITFVLDGSRVLVTAGSAKFTLPKGSTGLCGGGNGQSKLCTPRGGRHGGGGDPHFGPEETPAFEIQNF